MFCTNCGVEVASGDKYCSQCAAPTGQGIARAGDMSYNRLTRPRSDRKVAGVSAGLARYLGVDVTLIRILFIALSLWPPGVGLVIYVVCWIVMPNDRLLLAAPATPLPSS